MSHRFFAGSAVVVAMVLQVSAARAADPEAIQQAVKRGVEHLRSLQAGDGSWPTHHVGATALVGLTLLECGVPATDPAVQQAAEYLRKVWTDINDGRTTYALSLVILFLDRLREPADTPIIQTLAVRLLAGQNAVGAWSYQCPATGPEDLRRLRTLLERQVELKAKGELPRPAVRKPGDRPALPRELQQLLTRLEQRGPAPQGRRGPLMIGGGDNSNTQFAILGLWAGRRHGVPVEKALARTAAYFRGSQHADGGWGYMTLGGGPRFGGSTASMTCAGLLGLALGFGGAREAVLRTAARNKSGLATSANGQPDPAKDHAVRNGFTALGRVIGQPLAEAGPGGGAAGIGDMYYLLWSVERVAVTYGRPTIGNKDWYAWGAGLLLAAQQAGGSWQGKFGSDIDTSFALLFLRRANLNPDLTAILKGRDTVTVALKAGDVPGGEAASPRDDDMATTDGDKEARGHGEKAAQPTGERKTKPQAPPSDKIKPREAPPVRAATGDQPRAGKAAKAGGDRDVKALPAPPVPAAKTPEAEAARLGAELLTASGPRQEQVLEQLKQAKGAIYTEALAAAIGRLSGPLKTRAREALAERLARLTPASLRDKVQDEAAETRRAAALACALKGDKQFIPGLVTLLSDVQPGVARAAHVALKDLTKKDFGPEPDAARADRLRAAAAWREWWNKQQGK